MDEHGRAAGQMPPTIGRYQVLESIGYGAMGAVYKAFDPLIKRTLAIKTIRLDIPRSSPQYRSFIDRFYHEARISGTLSHPHIVTLFDIGEEGGLPYLAMEFVEGQTISSLIEGGTRFKPEKVISLISQVASAVDYAHSKGVIHRDIKPSNLILNDGERVKVTDFGIAKLVDAEMTQSGTLLGTPAYMSPEQAMGEKLDGRSDIFSLGVCAFEMLSGEQPFAGPNVTSILYKLVHVDPIEPANLEMSGLIPQKWREVFGRVLAKKPDDRYQTATEFVQDLEYCLGSWFGGVGETIADDSPVAIRAMAEAAAAGAEPHDENAPTRVLPPPTATDTPEPPEEFPATVVMNAAAVAASTEVPSSPAAPEPEGTILVRPGAPPEPDDAASADSTLLMPAARAESTVLVPSPGTAAKPPGPPTEQEPETTVLMPSPAAAAGRPEPQAEHTVLMPAPAGAGAGAQGGSPPTVLVPEAARRPSAPAAATGAAVPAAAGGPPTAAPPATAPAAPGAAAGKGASSKLSLPVLGGAALVGLLLIGGLAFLVLKGRSSSVEAQATPPPTTPAAVVTPPPAVAPPVLEMKGSLSVGSTPAGASVIVNGEPKGVTPLELGDLPMGAHEVKLELRGYAPGVQKVVLSPESPRSELQLALSRTAPALGTAEITSQPSGALVKIDGIPSGHTPFMDKLKFGTHAVEVIKEGYEPWSGSVVVKGRGKTAIHAWLKSVAPTPAPSPTFDPNRIYAYHELDTRPQKSSGRTASYPRDAPRIKSGESVSVILRFLVGQDGSVSEVTVVQSAGPEVDAAVIKALRESRYSPGIKNGVKVKTRMELKQTFVG